MSDSDLQFYIANKELLESKNGFATKRTGPFAGLRNHGATCYLNSLIQCLFHDSEFVKLILETSDNPDSAIITEMKKLFSRLVMSTNQSIDTESLLTAFGWSKSQLFEQHDIHELFSVLLDALGKDSASLNAGISKLFQGHMTDVLKCSSCAHESKNATTFLNFSLDMPDHTAGEGAAAAGAASAAATHCQLRDLLHKHLQPETLDADNMWLCSGCQNKVCATKAQEYSQLPGSLMMHLKRFRYDPATKRRRKLTTPVHFPLTLSADEFFGTAGNFGTYRLSGVVLHSGTAMGGHYRCYVSTGAGDGASWVDCNDASVTALTAEDVTQMFAEPTASAFTAGGKGSFVHDNVYMLLYKAVGAGNAAASMDELKQLIPAPIQAEIDAENESFLVRFRLQDIRTHVVSLTVRVHDNSAHAVQLDLLKTATLSAALQQAHAQLVAQGKLDSTRFPITNCRLRKYGKRNLSSLGETFGGRESATLEDIGLTSTGAMALETRTADDGEFTEFNPSDMTLQFAVWTAAQRVEHSVLVPNRELATVADLRDAVAHKLGADRTRLVLIKDDPTVALELLSVDADVLSAQHRIFPGDNTIVIEITPEGSDLSTYQSAAFSALEESRNKAVIYYNKPTTNTTENSAAATADTAESESAADSAAKRDLNYPFSVEVSVDMTLAAFKAQVAPGLGVTDPSTFFCKRSAASSAPQLKDEGKTLRELAFVNHSVIHLQLGQGCKSGEHMLKIEVDTASATAALQSLSEESAGGIAGAVASAQVFVALGDLAVSEKATVLQLKQLLFSQWTDLASRCGPDRAILTTPQSAAHIRLRDGKSGKVSGPLRDDRIVGRCLLGLADGRRLVAQVLDAPECISADDLVISLRVASFDRRILYPSIDLPITRSSTMKALYDKISSLVPQLNEPLPAEYLQESPAEVGTETLSLAKGFTSGPALTLKSAYKLKWDEPAVLHALANPTPAADAGAAEAPVEVISAEEAANGEIDEATLERSKNLGSVGGLDRPPLNLRDGSIVVVRSKADFWRATLTMRARKAQDDALEEAGMPRRPTTAGTGAAVARNRKSVKARIAAANGTATSGSASADVSEDEVLVKGAPPSSQPSAAAGAGASAKRGGERGLKINSSTKDRPPVPVDGTSEAKLSPSARKGTIEDELEHSMEDLPPPVAE